MKNLKNAQNSYDLIDKLSIFCNYVITYINGGEDYGL